MGQDKEILLSPKKPPRMNPGRARAQVRHASPIIQFLRLPDGTVKVLVEGKERAIVRRFLPRFHFFLVEAEEIHEF